MSFEWVRFFDTHGVEYATSGSNVSRGHVAVHCPFCGPDDQSQHMSVNLDGKGWRCFRHPDHRGRDPTRLVQGLLSCSWEHAARLVGTSVFIPEDFHSRVMAQLLPQPAVERPALKLPPEFKRFSQRGRQSPSARPFVAYLRKRKLEDVEIFSLTDVDDVWYCTRGPFKGRVIFPVRHEGALVSWTGRTIHPSVELRYKTLSDDPERTKLIGLEPAVGPISDYLLWYDNIIAAKEDTICICEGPFDALLVKLMGEGHGICATCFFTSTPSAAQVNQLHTVLPRFRNRLLLLDADTMPQALRISSMLSGLGVVIKQLPQGVKDPAMLSQQQLLKLVAA